MRTKRLAVLAVSLLITGCAPLGMMYVHRDTLGLDVNVGVDSTSPFKVNLGQSNHMATYVPVAVPKDNIPVGSKIGELAAQMKTQMSPDDAKAVLAEAFGSDVIDMFSVYSTFANRSNVERGSVVVDRGNVFATGLAARKLADTDRLRSCLALEKLADANKGDNTKYTAVRASIDALCGDGK